MAGSRPVEGFGGGFFVAAGGKELFSYSPLTLRVQRIDVELAEDGMAKAPVLKDAKGEMRAVRQ